MAQIHVMVDVETLSTRSDAALIQIAALAFDPETGAHLAAFDNPCMPGPGDHLDLLTVGWWARQTAVATVLGKLGSETASVEFVLAQMVAWFEGLATIGHEVVAVWSHGATFDLPILESACRRHLGRSAPWHYRTPRDTRTLYMLAPGGMPEVAVDPTREHDALYDCEVQVQQVVGALAALRAGLAGGQQA
jgi:hypothetical protein